MQNINDLEEFGSDEQSALEGVLQRLALEKTPVRLEVENANVHFFTVFSIWQQRVMLARPPKLTELRRGGHVRFKVPYLEGRELRLKVIDAEASDPGSNPAAICDIPKRFANPTRRSTDRFNTSRFSNLHLGIPAHNNEYRIIDLSVEGCKIYVEGEDTFSLNEPISPASIVLGAKRLFDLEGAVPRGRGNKTVGIQFIEGSETPAGKKLNGVVKSLEMLEKERFQH